MLSGLRYWLKNSNENLKKKMNSILLHPEFLYRIRYRKKADNPGVWLMHCHVMSHLMKGQSIALWVTDKGIPPVPRNFPTCPIHRRLDFEETDDLVDMDLLRLPTSSEKIQAVSSLLILFSYYYIIFNK